MKFYEYLTEFIFVEHEPQDADIIFVPGGPYPDSARHAAELYKMGYAPYIMPSGKYSILKERLELPEELWQEILPVRTRDDRMDRIEAQKSGLNARISNMPEKQKDSGEIALRELKERIVTESDYLCEVMTQAGVPGAALLPENEATYTYENAIYSRKKLEQLGIPVKRAILCCQAFHARRSLLYYQEQFPEVDFIVCPVVTKGISRDSWYKTESGIDTVLGEVERCGGQFHEIMRQYLK